MTTAESRLISRMREMEVELTHRLQEATDAQKAEIEKWVNAYIASLNVEIPFSVKQVLDRGGAVRSYVFKIREGGALPDIQLAVNNTDVGYLQRALQLYEMSPIPQNGHLRITVIVEPVVS